MLVRCLFLLLTLAAYTSRSRADYSPSSCETSNTMRLVTDRAPWAARQEAGGAYLPNPFTFTPSGSSTPVTWPAGTIAIFGGNAAFNDVWISSDNANTWTLLSGLSYYQSGAYINPSYFLADGSRTSVCQHDDGTVYLTAGTFSGAKTSRVQKGNLTHWQQLANAPFVGRERASCVVDSDHNVYVFGGNRLSPTPLYSTNDIWVGANGGTSWSRITSAAAWPIREGQNTVVMKTNDRNLAPSGEIFIMSSGLYVSSSSYRMNDIWASVDRARTWQRINGAAPFFNRQDGNMALTENGVLVVNGGDCGSECNLNDIWASLDGGWTWGECCNHCGYDNSEDRVTMFDRDGYFVLMSGARTFPDKGLARDVWRSSFSFTNITAVMQHCKLPQPRCGLGLTCIPGGYCPCDPHGPGVVLQTVGDAPWAAARQEAGFATRHTPLTFTDVTVSPPVRRTFDTSIIFFGGKLSSTYYDDVWASGDNGASWSLISGVYNNTVAGNGNYLRDNSRSADCFDSTGRMYLIGGTNSTTNAFSSSVWSSVDGIDWFPMTLNAQFWPREASMCSTDHNNNVYIFGGSVQVYTRANDVWKSADGGRNWQLMTLEAPWIARTQHDSASWYSEQWQRTILYVANGIYNRDPGADRNNDIWASSDEGRSWIQINAGAPYNGRQDSQTDATPQGILVLTAGDVGTNTPGNVNDVWASLDGGYNWGLCNQSAGYTPREDQSIGFTPQGHMILTGGDAPWVTRDKFIYRSEGSFYNVTYVAQSCGLTIPYCGVGLRCWPSATQLCDFNCPARARSSSSSSGAVFPIQASSSSSSSSSVAQPFSSSSSTGTSTSNLQALLGCASSTVPPAGSVTINVKLDSTVEALAQQNQGGQTFGEKLIGAMVNTARSAHPNIQSSQLRCAQIVNLPSTATANQQSEVSVFILGGTGSNLPTASIVYTALQTNANSLQSNIRTDTGVSGASLNAPTPMEQPVVYQEKSESGKTSVGLTVGMAFVGLGVGILVALFLSFLCCGLRHDGMAKPVHSQMEPSSNAPRHEMELSHVAKGEGENGTFTTYA